MDCEYILENFFAQSCIFGLCILNIRDSLKVPVSVLLLKKFEEYDIVCNASSFHILSLRRCF